MLGLRRGRPDTGCGHHWHTDDHGWGCCRCPGRVPARAAGPEPGVGRCMLPAAGDGIDGWLAAPGEPGPAGHRPGRRRPRLPGPIGARR